MERDAITFIWQNQVFLPNIIPTLPQWPSAEMEPEQAGARWEQLWKIKLCLVHI